MCAKRVSKKKTKKTSKSKGLVISPEEIKKLSKRELATIQKQLDAIRSKPDIPNITKIDSSPDAEAMGDFYKGDYDVLIFDILDKEKLDWNEDLVPIITAMKLVKKRTYAYQLGDRVREGKNLTMEKMAGIARAISVAAGKQYYISDLFKEKRRREQVLVTIKGDELII